MSEYREDHRCDSCGIVRPCYKWEETKEDCKIRKTEGYQGDQEPITAWFCEICYMTGECERIMYPYISRNKQYQYYQRRDLAKCTNKILNAIEDAVKEIVADMNRRGLFPK